MVFPVVNVRMWELEYKESGELKNWCFWTVLLEKTLESPSDCKEIKPVHPKGNQSWIFIGRTDVEAETPILFFCPPDAKNRLIGKDSDAGKDWGQEEKGTTEDKMVGWHHWLDGHEFEQALGVGDGQGSLPCRSSWGLQRVGHDWGTELKAHLLPGVNTLWYLEEWNFQRTYKGLGAEIQAEYRESGNWNYIAYIKMLLLLGTCHIFKHWEH